MLDFSRQFGLLRDEILEAIRQVCDSQSFILGPRVTAFEADAAAASGATYGIGCGSGTDALWLALAAAGIGDSASVTRAVHPDIVITTPFTFFATASAILRAGARPAFADIDPRTFNLSSEAVKQPLHGADRSRIKAILPVHLYGQCADMDAFEVLRMDLPGLRIIEDAAQAFGGSWGSGPAAKPAGSLGDAAAFSFYPTKNLAAFGEAGLLTTSDTEVATRAKSPCGPTE